MPVATVPIRWWALKPMFTTWEAELLSFWRSELLSKNARRSYPFRHAAAASDYSRSGYVYQHCRNYICFIAELACKFHELHKNVCCIWRISVLYPVYSFMRFRQVNTAALNHLQAWELL